MLVSFGIAATAISAIAAGAFFQQRRSIATAHPLEGSVAKRVQRFEKYAGGASKVPRPDFGSLSDGTSNGGDYQGGAMV